jgi:hypothetical protein
MTIQDVVNELKSYSVRNSRTKNISDYTTDRLERKALLRDIVEELEDE